MAFLWACMLTSCAQSYRNPYGKLPQLPTPGDQMFASYLRSEVEKLESRALGDVKTLERSLILA